MSSRGLLALAGAAFVLVTAAAPAASIETATFGIDIVERDAEGEGRLRVPIEAGKTTNGELRVWSKHDEPLTLRLSVMPARVAEDGTASLGGDPEPAGWVDVPSRVELGAGEEQRVTVAVSAPRQLTAATKTVAVVAEAEAKGDAPAVLQRLAVTTYLVPDRESLIASLGWLPWIAVGLLLAVGVAAVGRARARPARDQRA